MCIVRQACCGILGDPVGPSGRLFHRVFDGRAHADAKVRYGVVAGLSKHDDPEAIAGLIKLSEDSDDLNRDWATFGLSCMTSVDTSALREALLARLTDADPEIRGEAMIGLPSVETNGLVLPSSESCRASFMVIGP